MTQKELSDLTGISTVMISSAPSLKAGSIAQSSVMIIAAIPQMTFFLLFIPVSLPAFVNLLTILLTYC